MAANKVWTDPGDGEFEIQLRDAALASPDELDAMFQKLLSDLEAAPKNNDISQKINRTLTQYGLTKKTKGDFQEAKILLEKAVDVPPGLIEPGPLAGSLMQLLDVCVELGLTEEAMVHGKRALSEAKKGEFSTYMIPIIENKLKQIGASG